MFRVFNIDGNLWQGGCQGGSLSPGFAWCISMIDASQGVYTLPPGTQFRNWPLDDDGTDQVATIEEAAAFGCEHLHEGPMLVHCQGGWNRSGVVVARMLIKQGRSPEDAIQLIRTRGEVNALCNPVFEAWLLTYKS